MLKQTFLLSAVLLLFAALTQAQAAVPAVPRCGEFEASFTLAGQQSNPYNPAQNDVWGVFHIPGGSQVRVPAFWDGDRWKVRYTPLKVGRYTLTITRNGHAVAPADLSPSAFRCIASSSPGFIRRDPADPQRFEFDSGRTYYPLGCDQAWTTTGLPDYPEMLALMGQNGMNWARVWMTAWDNKALDWPADKANNPKIGSYFLTAARRWDTIMDAAAKSHVEIQMCLQHHGQYTNQTDPNWKDNPANVANGGYLKNPDDFFTDPTARRLTKAKYRYIVARWGYSPHLLSYELFNEVQNIGEARSHFQDVVNWHKEMAAYIRSLDTNHHLVTTSNSPPGSPLAQIGLDYDQIHAYVPDIISEFSSLSVAGLKTPVFVGEWGSSGDRGLTAGFLHDGLWASLTSPMAGAGQFWNWDSIARENWWPQFRSATAFLQTPGLLKQTHWVKAHPQIAATEGRADLSFAPTGGWQATTSTDVTVLPSGEITGLSGVSSFIQGSAHRDMLPQPIVFHLQCAAPCQFQVTLGTIAHAGAHPQISVDGKMIRESDYPAASGDHESGATLSVDVPAGPHTVSLFNTGSDWFTVQRITVTNYAPALAVLAKGNQSAVLFWAYNRDRAGAKPVSGQVTLTGLRDGAYTLRYWDCWTGKPLGTPQKATAKAGHLTLTLPPVTKDIAGFLALRR